MSPKVFVYDPTVSDPLSRVRGVGRYRQLLQENFPGWQFISEIGNWKLETGNSFFINPFFNFLRKPITIKKIARKQVAVIHDLIPLKYPEHFPIGIKGKINIFLNKLSLKNYDLIVTDSEASKSDIVKLLQLKESYVKVIYPCLPKAFNVSNFDIRISNFCIYVGDATWNKNLVNLAKAIKLADVKCVFVGKIFKETQRTQIPFHGDLGGAQRSEHAHWSSMKRVSSELNNGWQKELREFMELTKNDKRFIFAGFINDEELIKLYQQAAVNLLPSRDEGFGFSYVEAASQRCPSLLADRPIFREISANAAVFVDP